MFFFFLLVSPLYKDFIRKTIGQPTGEELDEKKMVKERKAETGSAGFGFDRFDPRVDLTKEGCPLGALETPDHLSTTGL